MTDVPASVPIAGVGPAPGSAETDVLAARLRGPLLRPRDPEYEAARGGARWVCA